MARRLRTDDDGEPDRSNEQFSDAQKREIIADAARRIIVLKAERAKITESIGEVRADVKKLGVKMAEFSVALRLYELEVDDRNPAIDHLRLCFQALGIGQQSDLFPAPTS